MEDCRASKNNVFRALKSKASSIRATKKPAGDETFGGYEGGFRVAWWLRSRVWGLVGGYTLGFKVWSGVAMEGSGWRVSGSVREGYNGRLRVNWRLQPKVWGLVGGENQGCQVSPKST